MDGHFVICPLQGRGYKTGDPFTQGRAPVLGYDALTGQYLYSGLCYTGPRPCARLGCPYRALFVYRVFSQGRGTVLGYGALQGRMTKGRFQKKVENG